MAESAPTVTPSKQSKPRIPSTFTGSMMTSGRPEEAELIQAAMRGDSKKIELLLSMDRPLRRRSTLLSIPVRRVPIDIHVQDTMGRTALHWIASQGHEDCVDIIMKHLGTTSLVSNKDGRTALHEAVMRGHINIVTKFFTYNIFCDRENIDKADDYERTALHWAALRGYNTILDVLIENGADVKKISKDEKTALHLAINADNDTMKQKLLRAWIGQGGDEGLIRALLDDNKIQVDTKVDDGQTLLSVASEKGHADLIKLLIEKGADIEARGEGGQTPLFRAAEMGHEGVIKLLVEKGADIEARNKIGQTPLFRAAEIGNEGVVKLLVEKGADIEARNKKGQTPLSLATDRGHEHIVKLLHHKSE